LLGIAREFDPSLELKYNKFYIGLSKDGQPFNRGGPGCLNRFSASISGASAGVRLPSGVAAG
jgi:hypothetical protein